MVTIRPMLEWPETRVLAKPFALGSLVSHEVPQCQRVAAKVAETVTQWKFIEDAMQQVTETTAHIASPSGLHSIAAGGGPDHIGAVFTDTAAHGLTRIPDIPAAGSAASQAAMDATFADLGKQPLAEIPHTQLHDITEVITSRGSPYRVR